MQWHLSLSGESDESSSLWPRTTSRMLRGTGQSFLLNQILEGSKHNFEHCFSFNLQLNNRFTIFNRICPIVSIEWSWCAVFPLQMRPVKKSVKWSWIAATFVRLPVTRGARMKASYAVSHARGRALRVIRARRNVMKNAASVLHRLWRLFLAVTRYQTINRLLKLRNRLFKF